MAVGIKHGQILHDIRGFVLDRVQAGGTTNLNIPQERIYELGNFNSVTTIRDIPDLTFEIQSFDMSTELEGLVMGFSDGGIAGPGGTEIDFRDAMPLDVISPFRSGQNAFDIVKGIAIPYLTLESVAYRFGVRANSQQTFQFRGDTINYIPGSPYQQEFAVTAGANQVYNLGHTAIAYTEAGTTFHVLAACARKVNTPPTPGVFKRLFVTTNYTDTTTSITVLDNLSSLGFTKLNVVYGSTAAATYSASVNPVVSVKPAAIRGKDICVYVSDGAATPTMVRWDGIQTVDVNYRCNLQQLEELCNQKYVGQDFDSTDTTGNIVVRPVNPQNLQDKIAQISNVSTSVVAGPFSETSLPVEMRINNPDTGLTIKTIYVPDARFVLPSLQGRINQKAQVTFNFASDIGVMFVYNGLR